MKYVTDKFKGVKYADITVPDDGSFDDLVALKGNKKILAKKGIKSLPNWQRPAATNFAA